ncbi:DUF4384 domain-containing protein [Leptospira langatensis]|uniref:DUF4384 domain-containing protein n=1 Tax=Leptospira langatensis TaxID=2484983 RepID=A0A5F1ZWN2_9LEPT|nr:DUF4384 domain-containing protein [Leptospira langatensis]TGJ98164.1 DUF4384 domain-containing protein [Leptospira langatensis]TGL43078.1 DUF4384 domain-containing protein [Leptospira langatensis]
MQRISVKNGRGPELQVTLLLPGIFVLSKTILFISLFVLVNCASPSETVSVPVAPLPRSEASPSPSFLDKYNIALLSSDTSSENPQDELKDLLIRSERISVIDRQRTADVLNEISLSQTGITDTANAPRLGKILAAQKLIYLKSQKDRWSVELVDVETSKSEFLRSFKREKSEKIFTELTGFLTQNLLLRNLSALKPKSQTIKVSLNSSQKVYRSNEPVSFSVSTSEDCYVYLILLQSDGETLLLFPNSFQSNNFLKANVRLLIPDERSGYILAAGEPYGTDSIKLIASKSQLDLFRTKPYGDSPFGIIDRPFESVSRGIKIIQTTVSDGDWNTSELSIVTLEK